MKMSEKNLAETIQNKILSLRISQEYYLSCKDYPTDLDPVDIIMNAYSKAKDLFNPDSDNSIAYKTLSLYMEKIDDILIEIFEEMESFKAISLLLPMAIKIQKLINNGPEALKKKFSADLAENKEYYRLFDIDYYLELSRVENTEIALKELEEDINIKASTYYRFAYKEYLDILPYFEMAMSV